MSHLFFLSPHIEFVYFISFYLNWYPLCNFKPVTLQTNYFLGVVGQKPDFSNTQVIQYLRSYTILLCQVQSQAVHCFCILPYPEAHRHVFIPRPIPRPSWAYKAILPAFVFYFNAAPSCSPQSHRSEWKASPVRHSECTRTSTGSLGLLRSPFTKAIWCSPLIVFS